MEETVDFELKEDFKKGGRIFCSKVLGPERYGVLEIKNNKPISIVEKPAKFISPWAVTGIYTYDSSVIKRAKMLTPSKRNELEITDINKEYLIDGELDSRFFYRLVAVLLPKGSLPPNLKNLH